MTQSTFHFTMQADIGEAMATLATVRGYFDPATYKGIKKPRT